MQKKRLAEKPLNKIFIKPLYGSRHSSQDNYLSHSNFVVSKSTKTKLNNKRNMVSTFSLTTGYVLGAFIALLLFLYLLYALVKPEKF